MLGGFCGSLGELKGSDDNLGGRLIGFIAVPCGSWMSTVTTAARLVVPILFLLSAFLNAIISLEFILRKQFKTRDNAIQSYLLLCNTRDHIKREEKEILKYQITSHYIQFVLDS